MDRATSGWTLSTSPCPARIFLSVERNDESLEAILSTLASILVVADRLQKKGTRNRCSASRNSAGPGGLIEACLGRLEDLVQRFLSLFQGHLTVCTCLRSASNTFETANSCDINVSSKRSDFVSFRAGKTILVIFAELTTHFQCPLQIYLGAKSAAEPDKRGEKKVGATSWSGLALQTTSQVRVHWSFGATRSTPRALLPIDIAN